MQCAIDDVSELVRECGEPYSQMLSIDLSKGDPAYIKWFLAAFLYAKPIREESATKTYRLFEANGLTNADAIVRAGWDRLVAILDKGGYTRYDFSTADRLLEVFGNLQKDYDGSLSRLYHDSRDERDLERRLKELGKGIGPVTVSVFLRDMRHVWPKARPQPTQKIKAEMSSLGIDDLDGYAKRHGIDVVRLETALHRRVRSIRSMERRSSCTGK
jgi:hypothetical protein